MANAQDFDVMVFDTYTPRSDASTRNYDQWLADVDCPLFNSLDMVAAYYCWKVADAKGDRAPCARGATDPYTYFGFFGLNDEAGFEAMMSDPKAEAHVPVWVSQWSQYPEAEDMAENFFFSFARRGQVTPGDMTQTVLVVPYTRDPSNETPGYESWSSDTDAVSALAQTVRYESWSVERQLQGDYAPNGLDLFFVDSLEQAKPAWDLTPNAVLGTLVAGPT
ncbi:MAG: hypothetical protein GKS03_00590 [Alphaproteobacteria bacterium]|nr:hypothetical protein [Alphaproteobacteria bacterium]